MTTAAELAPAFDAARAICRHHAKSFYFASWLLPKRKRDAAYAVYAFCRMIDDAIDMDDDAIESAVDSSVRTVPGDLDSRLALFRIQLDAIYSDRQELPVITLRSPAQHALCAFAQTVHEYEIPKQYFFDLAEGCRMDLSVTRYATWSSLENYCYHVAGVVGLIMSHIFGLEHAQAQAQAVQMGNAMQLTNILRDVKEDFDRGRIYLPQEDLERFNYSEGDLAGGVVSEKFVELMRFEIARARSLFEAGSQGLRHLPDDGSRLTACAMAVIYAGILRAIERRRYDVFSGRAHLTTSQKLLRLPSAWRLARHQGPTPLTKIF